MEAFEKDIWNIIKNTKFVNYSLRANEHPLKMKALVCKLKIKIKNEFIISSDNVNILNYGEMKLLVTIEWLVRIY